MIQRDDRGSMTGGYKRHSITRKKSFNTSASLENLNQLLDAESRFFANQH
jgi:hypothetical protein